MTNQSAQPKKNLPFILIVIIAFTALCVIFIGASVAMDALGLISSSTPTLVPSPTPLSTATIPPPTASPSIDKYMQEYGGNPDVYIRIIALTDCAELQKEFDQAYDNLSIQQPGTTQYGWSIGYMEASDDRMKSIGCY